MQWKDRTTRAKKLELDFGSFHFSGSLNPRSSNNKIAKLPGGSEAGVSCVSERCGSPESLPYRPNGSSGRSPPALGCLDPRGPRRGGRAQKLPRACHAETKTLQTRVSWVPFSISDPQGPFARATLPFT